jgi:hypothetical protein
MGRPPALTPQQKQEFKLIEEKKFMKQNYFVRFAKS